MTNAELLEKSNREINWLQVCKNISKNHKLSEDLYQHCMLEVMMCDNNTLQVAENESRLRYYIGAIIRNQWINKYSNFNKEYRKYSKMIDGNDISDNYRKDFNDKLSDISDSSDDALILNRYISEIDNILNDSNNWKSNGIYDFYQREIFMMYFKLGDYNMVDGKNRDVDCDRNKSSFRRMESLTGISYVSLSITVKDTIEYIKTLLIDKEVL